eukprot:m.88375 g.88375  ORF g.88375 m.88375 type:complete len:776 (+) comp14938_c2_seq2:37-2364(+)
MAKGRKVAGVRGGAARASATSGGWGIVGIGAVLAVIVAALLASVLWAGDDKVTTPFPGAEVKALPQFTNKTHVDKYLWGSYRPHTYFGLRTRTPQSLLTGMMWVSPSGHQLRHFCDAGDGLQRYGWNKHDGSSFGSQLIEDGPNSISTSFVKQPGGNSGGDWAARLAFKQQLPPAAPQQKQEPRPVVLFLYVANEGPEKLKISNDGFLVSGKTEALGKYQLHFRPHQKAMKVSYAGLKAEAIERLHDAVLGSVDRADLSLSNSQQPKANLAVLELVFQPPFVVDIVFESLSGSDAPTRHAQLSAQGIGDLLKKHTEAFDKRFESTFALKAKGYSEEKVDFAQSAFSNMIGGMGYFYGHSLVRDVRKPRPPPGAKKIPPLPYFDAPLYTAVPSRPFFPRGFMWDEGFHQLLIHQWEPEITREVLAHWLDLMNQFGWIPREQILGPEAKSKVPAEFVVQPSDNANPPTWFLVVEDMLDHLSADPDPRTVEFLRGAYERFEAWFRWFDTQRGNAPLSYRWRGRQNKTRGVANPLTLTSGLDDYPRATHPDQKEYHVDLRCWMAVSSSVLSRMATAIGKPSKHFTQLANELSDNAHLDELHWSDSSQSYCDFGRHKIKGKKPGHQLVDNAFGYVSLMPFLTRILDPASPKLGQILQDMANTTLLWTDYGLRSLATTSPFYQLKNTENDPPYWRGAVWININFLALRALDHYDSIDGPFQASAAKLHKDLRSAIISNLFKEWQRTGFVWEQYDDKTGEGKGTRPFTGWSALVVAIMADKY